MSYDVVIGRSKAIEALLRRLGYEGRGLHELVSASGSSLSGEVIRACRKVATIRNKLMHEEGYFLSSDTLANFVESADYVIVELQNVPVRSPSSPYEANFAAHERYCREREAAESGRDRSGETINPHGGTGSSASAKGNGSGLGDSSTEAASSSNWPLYIGMKACKIALRYGEFRLLNRLKW
jgi:hypothetical protein